MSDATTVGEYLRELIRRAMANDDDDAEDADARIVRLCRGVLDRIDEGIAITEARRRVIAAELSSIAGSYDDGADITDDIAVLADAINRWS